MGYKIGITTECVSDLPASILEELNIKVINFDIVTDSGEFRDSVEISAENVFSYMKTEKKKPETKVPSANQYKTFFTEALKDYDEIIHISVSEEISTAKQAALQARAKMGRDGNRIHVFDSRHTSSGMGLLVYEACRLRNEGKNVKELISELNRRRELISTSFITMGYEHFLGTGRIRQLLYYFFKIFRFQVILAVRNGNYTIKNVFVGNYERACMEYVRSELKHMETKDNRIAIITQAGCNFKNMEAIENLIIKSRAFNRVYKVEASATVSCNCGPNTFGLMYMLKDQGK